MATAFSDLYGFIKNLIGDGDDECSLYGSSLLNSQIRTAILLMQNSAVAENGTLAEFTAVLTGPQTLQVVLQAAINILDPLPDYFQHKSPILMVTRRRDSRYVESLKDRLLDLEGGKFPIAMDTEFQAVMNSVYRWIADFNNTNFSFGNALTP